MLQNTYLRNKGAITTPVYIPGESYSFIINSDYLSAPDYTRYGLRLIDAGGYQAATGFATLTRTFPIFGSPLYLLHSTFSFPKVPNGTYRFQIYRKDLIPLTGGPFNEDFDADFGNLLFIPGSLTSNPILVENENTTNTMLLEFWDDFPLHGIPYDLLTAEYDLDSFRQRFRLPLSKIDLQYESERTNYRNVTDGKLRTYSQYRNDTVKIEARDFDDAANEALAAVLEHTHIQIDGLTIEPKTGLTITTNQISAVNKSTFDAYAANPAERWGIFAGFDVFIICGDAYNHPALTIAT